MEGRTTERDLILAPNEFAFISDETKGQVNTYVGSIKQSLANTDRPVVFDNKDKRFHRVSLEQAIQTFRTAPEGWYIILKNPTKNGDQPRTSTPNSLTDLEIGKKVNIPGPVSFPLWPGQMVNVVQGHHLKSNQYLLVRVYDEVGARENWKSAVIKPQKKEEEDDSTTQDMTEEEIGEIIDSPDVFTMGKLLIIKGTDVSFFIPPTGVEVVKDELGNYVRNAVTLERLEYCIRLDENGTKTYTKGPDVVFPLPTEEFIRKGNNRKFRAIELNEKSGIYIKVIATYEEEGQKYKVGDELFITGKEQAIYFPREEHAIVKYGKQQIHYATAVPPGEGRYVLNRLSGEIKLVRGPAMLLPDPRKEVLVRRVLENKHVALWFPGNKEAAMYNQSLSQVIENYGEGEDYVSDRIYHLGKSDSLHHAGGLISPQSARSPRRSSLMGEEATTYSWESPAEDPKVSYSISADEMQEQLKRKLDYTQPRQVTLDTKYEGAVAISVWTGYAVQVVSKTGERKVIVGPATHLLEYDEILEVMELSTGTPKNKDNKIHTVYLRVLHNKVSDKVVAETSDLCQVGINLSYCIDFTSDPNKWFNVEDYVGFVTERLRSIIRAEVKKHGVEDFYATADVILRDLVLGVSPESTDGTKSERPGRLFIENGMKIVDVDIAKIAIGDHDIERMLVQAQNETVKDALKIKQEQRQLEVTKEHERIQQAEEKATHKSAMLSIELDEKEELAKVEQSTKISLEQLGREEKELEEKKKLADARDDLHAKELERRKKENEQEHERKKKDQDLKVEFLNAEKAAFVEKLQSISPNLTAALQALGHNLLAGQMSEHLGPWAMLKNAGIGDVFRQLTKGTPLEKFDFADDGGNSGVSHDEQEDRY